LQYGARDVVSPAAGGRFAHSVVRELRDLENRRALRRQREALKECEQRAQALIDSSRDAVAYVHEGMHIYANPVYLDTFGFDEAEEITGIPILDMMAPGDHESFKEFLKQFGSGNASVDRTEIHALRADGTQFQAEVSLSAAAMDGEPCTQLVLRDLSVVQAADAKLAHQDPLTGLYNRQYLIKSVEDAAARANAGQVGGSLLYVELDGFHAVTERVGIAASDLVLAQVADLLRDVGSTAKVISRFGDETFALLLDTDRLDRARTLAEDLRRRVEEQAFDVERQAVILTCSIGVVLIGQGTGSAQDALLAADGACARAKQRGGNNVEVDQPSLKEYAEDQEWPRRIREALQANRFRLYYQPVMSLHGQPLELYEVLLRMLDADDNVLLPQQFLGFAARAGLMTALDRWVIDQAVATAEEAQARGSRLSLLVKLSDESLADDTLVSWLVDLLKSKGIPGDRFIFEVSEVSATAHLGQAKVFSRNLKALHAQFALAHFGQGAHSVGVLKHMPVDFVKISGALIHQLAHDTQRQATVRSIIETAHQMDKMTIAENVEEAASLAVLWQMGADYARGFYVQEPSPTLSFNFSASL
jgi:diguanylate cyclase (GGDEF)-like protein/PAS domain S-box-containing protein